MSDNLRRYCAIHSALMQLYPGEPTGNLARHLKTLAALICGIVGSRKTHLPAIASKAPDGNKRESRAKRFAHFLQNKNVTPTRFFAPYAQALVESLPVGPLVLVMDGSQVGRGCMALMVSVLYQKRALPLCWQVVKAKKGHFPQEQHRQLLARAKSLIPPGRQVVFLGDGEFDGCDLLADIAAAGWQFVCRTAKSVLLQECAPPRVCSAKSVLLCEADWSDELFWLSHLGLQPATA